MSLSIGQFVNKYHGKAVDFDSHYGAQCVDLFNFYNREVVSGEWIGTPVSGGARDLFEVDSNVRNKYYKRLEADSLIAAGDVLIYGPPLGRVTIGGKQIFYGHVAIYIGDGKVIQQNARISELTTIDPVSRKHILGILRPLRFIGESVSQEGGAANKSKNKHIIKQGDTFWGLEEENGWPHGTLQTINPELDATALRIGSTIITPTKSDAKPNTAKQYYTIRAGDTLWELEDAWQLRRGRLQELNPGIKPRELAIGARIRRT